MMWRLRVLGKIILARLPFGYTTFRRLGLFRHGAMHRADYAVRVVLSHLEKLGGVERVRGSVCLELGPGDSLASAVIASGLGARKIHLVDAGVYADRDIAVYRELAGTLAGGGLPAPNLDRVTTIGEMLTALNAEYTTEGLASLRRIPTGSVDLIWSHAVLEHIRLAEVGETFAELRRIMKPGGQMSHRVDFMDHLGGALNNLRFSSRVWESDFMVKSGFYTNRMRSREMRKVLEDAGFEITVYDPGKWDCLPTPREALAPPYRDYDEDDLRTAYVDVLAHPGD